MKQTFSKYLVSTAFALFASFAHAVPPVEIEAISPDDKTWFEAEFPRSYMSVYDALEFVIGGANGPIRLTQQDSAMKRQWLYETAVEEFQDYVVMPKAGYKAIGIKADGRPVGALLYRLLEEEKTLYLAHLFIQPEYRKCGIGKHVVMNVVPELHHGYRNYELVTRHQNQGARDFYVACGFEQSDENVVRKYGYDPSRYVSYVKMAQ